MSSVNADYLDSLESVSIVCHCFLVLCLWIISCDSSVFCAAVNEAGDELIVHAQRIINSAVDAIHSVCGSFLLY